MMDTRTRTNRELRPNVKVYFDLYLANNGLPSRLAQPGIKNKIAFKCKSITEEKIRVTSNLLVANMTQVHNRREK